MGVNQDHLLATRLEVIRDQRGLSLDEVANLSGISRATLSRIERAKTSPTASTLGKLCSVYGVTMSSVMLALEADSARHLRFSEAQSWRDPESGFIRVALSPPAQNYRVEVMHGTLPKGADVGYAKPPIEGMEQHIIVLKGELQLTFDDQPYHVRAMDCVALKLHGASRFQNLGGVDAEYLVINSKP